MEAKATFTVDGIDHGEPVANHPGTELSRARVNKTFSGDLAGTGTVEMMTAFGEAGRGSVAIEWIQGTLGGRGGGFALLHCGTQDGTDQWAVWRVVPGSGTDELEGIVGEGQIEVDADGTHRFRLAYELPA